MRSHIWVAGTIFVSSAEHFSPKTFINKNRSTQFLRSRRNNDGFDEEVFKSTDMEKECFEEVCNIYEADEIIQQYINTPEKSSLIHNKHIKHSLLIKNIKNTIPPRERNKKSLCGRMLRTSKNVQHYLSCQLINMLISPCSIHENTYIIKSEPCSRTGITKCINEKYRGHKIRNCKCSTVYKGVTCSENKCNSTSSEGVRRGGNSCICRKSELPRSNDFQSGITVPAYDGRFCENDVDECAVYPNICQNCDSGDCCKNKIGGFGCDCKVYAYEGPNTFI